MVDVIEKGPGDPYWYRVLRKIMIPGATDNSAKVLLELVPYLLKRRAKRAAWRQARNFNIQELRR